MQVLHDSGGSRIMISLLNSQLTVPIELELWTASFKESV